MSEHPSEPQIRDALDRWGRRPVDVDLIRRRRVWRGIEGRQRSRRRRVQWVGVAAVLFATAAVAAVARTDALVVLFEASSARPRPPPSPRALPAPPPAALLPSRKERAPSPAPRSITSVRRQSPKGGSREAKERAARRLRAERGRAKRRNHSSASRGGGDAVRQSELSRGPAPSVAGPQLSAETGTRTSAARPPAAQPASEPAPGAFRPTTKTAYASRAHSRDVPRPVAEWMAAADRMRRSERRQAAVELYRRVSSHPRANRLREEAYLRQAQLLAELGRPRDAVRVLQEADARVQAPRLGPERRALWRKLEAK